MARTISPGVGFRPISIGRKIIPPRIGNGFDQPVIGEINDGSRLEVCRRQALQTCRDVIATLDAFSQQRAGVDTWINGLTFSKRAKDMLRSLKGNITEIRRMRSAFEQFIAEILSDGNREEGGRKSKYFVFSPTDPDSVLFVSSLVYRPFDEWLEDTKLTIDKAERRLVVVSHCGRENALLTQGTLPITVNARGQRV